MLLARVEQPCVLLINFADLGMEADTFMDEIVQRRWPSPLVSVGRYQPGAAVHLVDPLDATKLLDAVESFCPP